MGGSSTTTKKSGNKKNQSTPKPAVSPSSVQPTGTGTLPADQSSGAASATEQNAAKAISSAANASGANAAAPPGEKQLTDKEKKDAAAKAKQEEREKKKKELEKKREEEKKKRAEEKQKKAEEAAKKKQDKKDAAAAAKKAAEEKAAEEKRLKEEEEKKKKEEADQKEADWRSEANKTREENRQKALTKEEKKALTKRKKGKVHKIAKKTVGWGDPSATPIDDRDKFDKATGVADAALEHVADPVAGVVGLAAGGAGSIMDLLSSTGKDILSELPFIGMVVDLVTMLFDGGKQIYDIVKLVKSCITDGADGWAIAGTVFDLISNVASTANTIFGVVGTISSYLAETEKTLTLGAKAVTFVPGVGLGISIAAGMINFAITAVNSFLSFVSHATEIVKAGRSWYKTRKQKKLAKEDMRRRQGTRGQLVKETKRGHLELSKADYGKTGSTGKRNKRLDEYTAEQRKKIENGDTADLDVDTLKSLENYDITKELEQSNKKRVREAGLDILMDDIEPIFSAFFSIDASGFSSIIGVGLDLLTTGAGLTRKGIGLGKKAGRALHIPGFDRNKTVKKKKLRRHSLALTVYKRIKSLNNYDMENWTGDETEPAETTEIRNALEDYDTVSGWIKGLVGMNYKQLQEAKDPDDMVKMMREGFYSGV